MTDSARPNHASLIRQALDDSSGGASSALAASWRRSMTLYGLDPTDSGPVETITEQQLNLARETAEPMVRASDLVLDRLYQAVGGVGCCVLLTNASGVPLERRGAPADDATFQRWGLWPGAVWSEATEGTNGIGTALVERSPVIIHREQHFHARNTAMSCVTHPLFDHKGQLVGALDVSSCRADATESLLNLISTTVADAARTIEAMMFRQAFADARIIIVNGAEDRNPAALLAVDRYDLVIGASRLARRMLQITDEQIGALLPASKFLIPAAAETDLEDAERGAIRRALSKNSGNVSAAARTLGISRATLHRKLNRLGLKDLH